MNALIPSNDNGDWRLDVIRDLALGLLDEPTDPARVKRLASDIVLCAEGEGEFA